MEHSRRSTERLRWAQSRHDGSWPQAARQLSAPLPQKADACRGAARDCSHNSLGGLILLTLLDLEMTGHVPKIANCAEPRHSSDANPLRRRRRYLLELGRTHRSLLAVAFFGCSESCKARHRRVHRRSPDACSVTVQFDPQVTDHEAIATHLLALVEDKPESPGRPSSWWRIPVCYDGELAPDLAIIAARVGISSDALAELHTQQRYRVYMVEASLASHSWATCRLSSKLRAWPPPGRQFPLVPSPSRDE